MFQIVIILITVIAPQVLYAAVGSFQELLVAIGSLIKMLIPLAIAIALLVFFWGVSKTIRGQGNEKAIEEGKRVMIWGLVALFVMVSIWGIIEFLQGDIFGRTHFNPFELTQ